MDDGTSRASCGQVQAVVTAIVVAAVTLASGGSGTEALLLGAAMDRQPKGDFRSPADMAIS